MYSIFSYFDLAESYLTLESLESAPGGGRAAFMQEI